jgi:hypothetical protein
VEKFIARIEFEFEADALKDGASGVIPEHWPQASALGSELLAGEFVHLAQNGWISRDPTHGRMAREVRLDALSLA